MQPLALVPAPCCIAHPMIDPGLWHILLLAVAAFVAGFIDSIAGGGGLITVPALLLAGYGPVQSLATNKLQSLFGAGSATLAYASRGLVDLRTQGGQAAMSAAGAACGALVASHMPADVLKAVLPVSLVAIALYFGLRHDLSDDDRHRRMNALAFTVGFVPVIGFYDGVFGPGTGSFFMLGFVALAGYGVLKATAHTKLLNFASNVGAFAVFAFAGAIDWRTGLAMGAAQFAGARIGAHTAIRGGARLIRPLLVVVCVALALRLLADPANPLRAWTGL